MITAVITEACDFPGCRTKNVEEVVIPGDSDILFHRLWNAGWTSTGKGDATRIFCPAHANQSLAQFTKKRRKAAIGVFPPTAGGAS